jgi:hypothetical protein
MQVLIVPRLTLLRLLVHLFDQFGFCLFGYKGFARFGWFLGNI